MDFNTLLTALLTNGIGGACAFGVLWFAWYRETKTIPEMVKAFTATQERLVTAFSEQMKYEREVCERRHDSLMVEMRTIEADLKEQRHAIKDLTNALNIKAAYEQAKTQPEPK